MRSILSFISLIPLCFAGGWLIGSVEFSDIKKAVVDSYVNRYNAASGTNVDEVIYYVVSESQKALDDIATADESIRHIEHSGYPRLFNVYLNYADRRETLKTLRAHESVSAVFTVPFICH